MGVVEKEHDIAIGQIMAATRSSQPQTLGHSSLLIATLVSQPAHEMAAAPERAHIMVATADPVHKMADTTMPMPTIMPQLPSMSQVKS